MPVAEKPLQLPYHPQYTVIHQHHNDRQSFRHRCPQLIKVHRKAAVPRKEYGFPSCPDAGTVCRPHTKAHRAKAAAGQEGARLCKGISLRHPHLVLPYVRYNRRILRHDSADRINNRIGC